MNNPFQELAERLSNIENLLLDLKNPVNSSTPEAEDELLTVQEAAHFLRVTVQTVYDKIHNGTLPSVKQGNRVYFFKSELILWLKAGRRKTAEDLAQQASQVVTQRRGRKATS